MTALEQQLAREMRGIVFAAAEPISAGETVKTQMRKAWQALGRPAWWRVKAAWYGEAGPWSGTAHEDMRRRHAERLRREATLRDQAADLGRLYAGIAEAISTSPDAERHRLGVAGLLEVARALGGDRSALDAAAGPSGDERRGDR